jgi:hypothetical protein
VTSSLFFSPSVHLLLLLLLLLLPPPLLLLALHILPYKLLTLLAVLNAPSAVCRCTLDAFACSTAHCMN